MGFKRSRVRISPARPACPLPDAGGPVGGRQRCDGMKPDRGIGNGARVIRRGRFATQNPQPEKIVQIPFNQAVSRAGYFHCRIGCARPFAQLLRVCAESVRMALEAPHFSNAETRGKQTVTAHRSSCFRSVSASLRLTSASLNCPCHCTSRLSVWNRTVVNRPICFFDGLPFRQPHPARRMRSARNRFRSDVR